MKFNRTALIARIDSEIKRRTDDAAREDKRKAEQAIKDREVWVLKHADKAKKAAQSITARLKKGEPVTWIDLGLTNGGGYRDWPAGESDGSSPTDPRTGQLTSLRRFLELVGDDEVTSSGLRDAGYRDLASILR